LNPIPFSLQPFPGNAHRPGLKIGGTIGRRGETLSLTCSFRGDLSEIAIAMPGKAAERRDRLWEETCLELFLAGKSSEGYREFHLSPSGHWNVYRFARYREEMREDRTFSTLPFQVGRTPAAIRFSLDLEIGGIVQGQEPVEAAVCAVVRAVSGAISHWALVHPGPRPDFHRREGFSLTLPAE